MAGPCPAGVPGKALPSRVARAVLESRSGPAACRHAAGRWWRDVPGGLRPSAPLAAARKGFYHSIALPDGRVLDGLISLERLQQRLAHFPLPQDLSGKRVLDIGAWDGWFSFEAEKRGADVMAVDCVDIKGFREAHALLQSKVDYRILDVDELSPATVGYFDIVMFLGVLYHLRHPLLALERICQLTRDMALVESFVTDDGLPSGKDAGRYLLEFYETNELCDALDNWYGPNTACLLALCRAAGFARVVFCGVVEQRAHVTCYRHWEAPPQHPRLAPPSLASAVNNRSSDHHFRHGKDEYVCMRFTSEERKLQRDQVFPEIDGYGVPVMRLMAETSDAWSAYFRFPGGLETGHHEVQVRTAESTYSNSLTVQLHPGLDAGKRPDIEERTTGGSASHRSRSTEFAS